MSQEHGKERTVLVLQGGQPVACGVGQRQQLFPDEDEAWRSFLENPLTAASKAMMSINGDEDSAAALSLLYDYYKVPKEKTKKAEVDSTLKDLQSLQRSSQAMTTLKNVPLSVTAQLSPPGWDKASSFHHFHSSPSPSTSPSSSSVYLPAAAQDGVSQSHAQSHAHAHAHAHSLPIRGASSTLGYSSHQFSPSGYSSVGLRAQAQTPDSTYTEGLSGAREVMAISVDMHSQLTSVSPGSYSQDGKLFSHQYEYAIEAPRSMCPKNHNTAMSYVNKGHFYPIQLRCLDAGRGGRQANATVRSVVMVVFHDKCVDDQLKAWKFWHSRQPSAKQRCIDIADYKESLGVSNIEEIAFNAISFTWNTEDEPKIYVSVNCLSTDFSPQKGVKGLPLDLQVDTYSCGNHGEQVLLHRAYCQIKVFCDKGAERKIRDEERKVLRRKGRGQDGTKSGAKVPIQVSHVETTVFKTMSDMVTQPVLFIPKALFTMTHRHASPVEEALENVAGGRSPYSAEEFGCSPSSKRARRDKPQRVLLYVRQEPEEVFDAVMLQTPTLLGLIQAISDKYNLPLEKVSNVYKKSKKGIVVNMDDNIVQHYSNEDTFQMDLKEDRGTLSLTLTEI
ncbi:grainyhead-like protein 1 homolog [Engraulis encrasicolus]|uniref:grainyhead-like protein 1 homolog n=1 Tax=Engraulis encrasicolus TaxID=184585 RepID=UPI002FD19504